MKHPEDGLAGKMTLIEGRLWQTVSDLNTQKKQGNGPGMQGSETLAGIAPYSLVDNQTSISFRALTMNFKF
jgi:hypothetical protein